MAKKITLLCIKPVSYCIKSELPRLIRFPNIFLCFPTKYFFKISPRVPLELLQLPDQLLPRSFDRGSLADANVVVGLGRRLLKGLFENIFLVLLLLDVLEDVVVAQSDVAGAVIGAVAGAVESAVKGAVVFTVVTAVAVCDDGGGVVGAAEGDGGGGRG